MDRLAARADAAEAEDALLRRRLLRAALRARAYLAIAMTCAWCSLAVMGAVGLVAPLAWAGPAAAGFASGRLLGYLSGALDNRASGSPLR